MLNVEEIVKDFGSQRVLDGASLTLRNGERAALVGANGAGKSTLLRILGGAEEPDAGHVAIAGGAETLGYLPQDASVEPTRTLHDEVLSGVADLLAIEQRMRTTEHLIDRLGVSEAELERLVLEHARLHEEFERRGGYEIEANIGRVLAGLGFVEADRVRLCSEFSGGWQMRIALARLLVSRPSVLLLDEPTNHLDLSAVEWLEGYLTANQASLLVVSHDRAFMDAVVERVYELRQGRVEEFVGNYSRYREERQRRDAALVETVDRQREEVERLGAYIRRYKAGNRATMAKSREKMLARVEAVRIAAPPKERATTFRFPACPPSGREVIKLSHVRRAYGDRVVLDDVSFSIERGERVAMIGPNGAGKSTLLRTIASADRPQSGVAVIGIGVRVAYFAQDQSEQLDMATTVMEEVFRAAPASWDNQATRDLLGRFMFSGDEQMKPISGLSGGERSRVALAKMLLRPCNLLLLDEPTNHLDVTTRERLEQTLADYPGTLVFVSHDRFLVNRLATKVMEVAEGGVRIYPGNYADYRRAKQAAVLAAIAAPSTRPLEVSRREERKPSRDGREQRKLALQIRDLERQITEAEAHLEAVEARLSNPSGHVDDLTTLSLQHAELAELVATLTAHWEAASIASEGAA